MPTNEELAKTNTELRAKIKELEEKLANQPKGLSGWIITAKNPGYKGAVCGIQFRSGRAFVPDVQGAKAIVSQIVDDFGYKAEYLENFNYVETAQRETGGSLIDALMLPQVF